MSNSGVTDLPTLDDMVLSLLAAARSRGPGRYPTCPVCGQPMTVVEGTEDGSPVLRCDACGTRLEDAEPQPSALQLVA